MSISKNDTIIAFILKNGPKIWYVCVYDFSDRKPRKVLMEPYYTEIISIEFMPRDSSKLLITGHNLFALMAIGKHGSVDLSEFEGVPNSMPTFTNTFYRENDHLIGTSDKGHIFVCEGM
jgi:hypothetical protein